MTVRVLLVRLERSDIIWCCWSLWSGLSNPIGLRAGAVASQIKADSGLGGFCPLSSCCSEQLDLTDHNVLYISTSIVNTWQPEH